MSYATNTRCSIEKIMDLINDYPYYISRINELRKNYQGVVSGGNIAQYGIEATLPKPQGNNTDPIQNEVQRLLRMDKELSRLEHKVLYVQNRMDRILDEKMNSVFHLRLCGKTYKEIANELNLSSQRVHQIMKEICYLLQD